MRNGKNEQETEQETKEGTSALEMDHKLRQLWKRQPEVLHFVTLPGHCIIMSKLPRTSQHCTQANPGLLTTDRKIQRASSSRPDCALLGHLSNKV